MTYVGTSGGGSAVPPGREGGAGGALPVASPGRLGTAGAGRPVTGGAGGARLTDEPGPEAGAGGAPLIGRRLGPPGDGGDTRWPILQSKWEKYNDNFPLELQNFESTHEKDIKKAGIDWISNLSNWKIYMAKLGSDSKRLDATFWYRAKSKEKKERTRSFFGHFFFRVV